MLDLLGVPYVFSGTLASALAMNKYKTKIIAQELGIETARSVILRRGGGQDRIYRTISRNEEIVNEEKYGLNDIVNLLSLPIVIKPMELGSSVGVSIAKSKNKLASGITEAFNHGSEIMLEQYIAGKELAAAVMTEQTPKGEGEGGIRFKALPLVEITPQVSSWFDYRAKYEKDGSREICPARVPDTVKDHVQKMAVRIFAAIGCKDVARADFIFGKNNGKVYFLEINTIPGMTKTSLVPRAARAAGMSFSEFLDKLIEGALRGRN